MSFSSVFERQFDVAIYGAGFAGVAAALSLQRAGRTVLLFDRRFDVVWEAGRSFLSQIGECHHPLWEEILQELRRRHLANEGTIDTAGAEVLIAARLRELRPQIGTLLGAWPLEARLENGEMRELTVATKSGLRKVSARQWIDASDELTVHRLMFPQETPAPPAHYEYRAILFHKDGEEAVRERETRSRQQENSQKENSSFLEKRLWQNEFVLGIKTREKLTWPQWMQRAEEERARLMAPLSESVLVALSPEPLPVSSPGLKRGEESGANCIAVQLSSLSTGGTFGTLGERFLAGIQAAQTVREMEKTDKKVLSADQITEMRRLPSRKEACDIFVAGAGTAGAVAALAAGKANEGRFKVLCTDTASFAGGVGSGGLITGYFHGQPGGFFEGFDREAARVSARLNPERPARSHDSKKIVFEQWFSEQETNRFLPETLPFAVETDGSKVRSIQLITPFETIQIGVKAVIDATGDGDIAALSGAEWQMGRKEDGFPLSYSQPGLISVKNKGASGIRPANFDAGWVDPTDPEDLTRARLTAIAQYQTCEFSEEFHLVLLAPILGLRQSRQIETDETLTLEKLLSHHRSKSSIGETCSPLDTHSVDYEFEDDETLFWLWGCKAFRESTFADLPYGITTTPKLQNLWIAGRAAGIAPAAAYAARMQRDMQRIGEATGYAAVLSLQESVPSQEVPLHKLQEQLKSTQALDDEPSKYFPPSKEELLQLLDRGVAGAYLWPIYRRRKEFESELLQRLNSSEKEVSWLSALLLAMWEDPRAEPRLIAALTEREEGGETPASARGPFGQWIDVPNWFLAVSLLRRCGSGAALPALKSVAEQPKNILNLRTSIGLTLARLAKSFTQEEKEEASQILKLLLRDEPSDVYVRPSRSFYRAIRGEEQEKLPQEPGTIDTREDHRWRLDFAVAKAAHSLEVPAPDSVRLWLDDERALVRRAFEKFC